jgi:hypothetical protein
VRIYESSIKLLHAGVPFTMKMNSDGKF